MNQILINFIQYFGQLTHLNTQVLIEGVYLSWSLALFGLFICFFGYKLYRPIFSFIMLIITIILTVIVLKDVQWRYVVTTFSILSVLIAFSSYFWRRVSVLVTVGLIVYVCAIFLNIRFEFAIILAISGSILSFFFPFWSTILSTSVFGSILGSYLFIDGLKMQMNQTLIIMGLLVLSIVFQILTNKSDYTKLVKNKGL